VTGTSALARSKAALAAGAGMLLVAGLGVGYVVNSQGEQCAEGSAGCERISTVSTNLGVSAKVATGKNACNGVALTFFADSGAPGVISNVFPVGTKLKITNLDNSKSATVPVTGVSGSCALLNTTAMDLIREPGKNVVRRNTVERVQ
jgi:hypothetical protein